MTTKVESKEEYTNSAEENKAIIRRFIAGYNSRNMDVFEELVASDYFDQLFQQRGRDKFKEMFTMAGKISCAVNSTAHQRVILPLFYFHDIFR